MDLPGRGKWPPMLWIGGGQGAGKTILSWHLSRANDLPLHPIDLWTYDHQARTPAGDSLDEQLARGPEAAADAFESHSRLRLKLVLDDIAARDLGKVPALVEGPQLMPGLAAQLPPGWCVWLLPDPARTRMTREERLANEETLAGRRCPAALVPLSSCSVTRSSPAASGKAQPSPAGRSSRCRRPCRPAIAAAIESALAPAWDPRPAWPRAAN